MSEDVERWLRCPACGSGKVTASQPRMYHSTFECEKCGESHTQGWVYYGET